MVVPFADMMNHHIYTTTHYIVNVKFEENKSRSTQAQSYQHLQND